MKETMPWNTRSLDKVTAGATVFAPNCTGDRLIRRYIPNIHYGFVLLEFKEDGRWCESCGDPKLGFTCHNQECWRQSISGGLNGATRRRVEAVARVRRLTRSEGDEE